MPRIDHLARLDLQAPVANHQVDVAQIFDPFVGTGNTIQAAIRMHRNSIGYELEPGYLDYAEKRLRNSPQSVVFHRREK